MAANVFHFQQKFPEPRALVRLSHSFCEQTNRPCGSTALLYGSCKDDKDVMRIKVEGESQTVRIHSSDYEVLM